MPRLPKSASKEKKKSAMADEMGKFKRGELHSGSKNGPRVTDRNQAIAISLSVSGQSKNRKKKRNNSRGGRRNARS
jgi:hypothetical protein